MEAEAPTAEPEVPEPELPLPPPSDPEVERVAEHHQDPAVPAPDTARTRTRQPDARVHRLGALAGPRELRRRQGQRYVEYRLVLVLLLLLLAPLLLRGLPLLVPRRVLYPGVARRPAA